MGGGWWWPTEERAHTGEKVHPITIDLTVGQGLFSNDQLHAWNAIDHCYLS